MPFRSVIMRLTALWLLLLSPPDSGHPASVRHDFTEPLGKVWSQKVVSRPTSYKPWALGYLPGVSILDEGGHRIGDAIKVLEYRDAEVRCTYYWPSDSYIELRIADGAYSFSIADLSAMCDEWKDVAPMIRGIEIKGADHSFGVSWFQRLGEFGELTRLNILAHRRSRERVQLYKDVAFGYLPASWPSELLRFRHLRHLGLQGITDPDGRWGRGEYERGLLAVLARLPIEELVLGSGMEVYPAEHREIGGLCGAVPNLRALHLRDAPPHIGPNAFDYSLLFALKDCPSLERLTLEGWHLAGDAVDALAALRSSVHISLLECFFDSASLLQLVQSARRLTLINPGYL